MALRNLASVCVSRCVTRYGLSVRPVMRPFPELPFEPVLGGWWLFNARLRSKPSDEMLTFEIEMAVYLPSEQEALNRLWNNFLLQTDVAMCFTLIKAH